MSMPNFTKSSPAVIERFYELLELVPDANRKAMFGFPAATLGGNLFFSLFNENAILRLPDAERERLGPDLEIEQFAPAPGRPMTGFMVLPADVFASPAAEPWVLAAAAHARTMPPKKPVRGPTLRQAQGPKS